MNIKERRARCQELREELAEMKAAVREAKGDVSIRTARTLEDLEALGCRKTPRKGHNA